MFFQISFRYLHIQDFQLANNHYLNTLFHLYVEVNARHFSTSSLCFCVVFNFFFFPLYTYTRTSASKSFFTLLSLLYEVIKGPSCFIKCSVSCLKKNAVLLLLWRSFGSEHSANGFVKHALEAFLGQGRALEVLLRLDLFGHGTSLRLGDGLELPLAELVDSVTVVSEVELGPD